MTARIEVTRARNMYVDVAYLPWRGSFGVSTIFVRLLIIALYSTVQYSTVLYYATITIQTQRLCEETNRRHAT